MTKTTLVAGVLAYCCAITARAQTPETIVAFEVATIARSDSSSGPISMRRLPGGRFVTSNTPLTMLISWAFSVDDGRLVDAPKGLDSIRFDVVAKAYEEEPAPGQMQLMMQSLLAERFNLVVHPEKRELTSYTLVTDAGGAKVRVSNTQEPPDPNPFRMSGSGNLTGTRVTADMLAKVLSNQLGRPVQNLTGFTGAFDFALQWTPDSAVTAGDDRPSLFTAIREQLGFRLVASKMPVDVIVIDHVERTPKDN